MKVIRLLVVLILCSRIFQTFGQEVKDIIPTPVEIIEKGGFFSFSPKTQFLVEDESYLDAAAVIAQRLKTVCGKESAVIIGKEKKNSLLFSIDSTAQILKESKEAYILDISNKSIVIKASSPKGWFYAMETIMQLLPAQVENKQNVLVSNYKIPTVLITDFPRFPWRGLMVDLSRHYFSKDVLKAYINQMSKYKLNVLHLHLTDNQGWRIEIKGLPKLTEVGAWRVPRTGYWKGFKAPQPGEVATYGGFYSQDDIRELVQYAQARQVELVPEIDVPGHSLALIASYPELSCTKTPQDVLAGDPWNASRTNVLCVSNDSVYQYLDLIFSEIADLFPSQYIHIGGDEVTRNYWKKCPLCQQKIKEANLEDEEELQTYFLKRLTKIIESKGKKAIGWYENLKGGMPETSVAMSWKSYEGGIKSSQKGQKVIMTPAFFTYLDFYQGDPLMENGPFTVARFNQFYKFDPVQDGVVEHLVLGGQGSLWTEQVPNERKLQAMTWPRSLALAEILWSSKERKPWNSFVKSVEQHFPRFDVANVKYSTNFYEPIVRAKQEGDVFKVIIDTEVEGLEVYYSFDDTSPDQFYPKYEGMPIIIPSGAHHIRLISYKEGKPIGRELNLPLEEIKKRK